MAEVQRIIDAPRTIGAAIAIDRDFLRPVAGDCFDLATVSFPVINASGTADVLTNFYSAPLAPGTKVQGKAYAAHVEIWHEGRWVAWHGVRSPDNRSPESGALSGRAGEEAGRRVRFPQEADWI